VINAENRDTPNPDSTVLGDDKRQTCVDIVDSSIASPRGKRNGGESALVSCENYLSKKFPHHFNETNESEVSLQKPTNHISGAGNFSNVTASSPLIGSKKLSPGVRCFHGTNRRTLKRTRGINDSLQQEVLSSLRISRRNDRNGSFELNKINLKPNEVKLPTVDLDSSPTVGEKELSPAVLSQWNKPSVNNMVSPVMKCDRRWRNRKHRNKVSRLRKNSLNDAIRLDRSRMQLNDVGLKEINATESICSPNLNVSPSSPVLVKSREKRFKRKKLMMTVKLGDCIDEKEFMSCDRASSREDVSLLDDCILATPQQKHMRSEFNDIHGPIILRGDVKTEDDSGLRGNQNYENCDSEGDCLCTENAKVWNDSKGSGSSVVECSIEANIIAEKECSEAHSKKDINPSPQEIGKVLKEHGHCGRKSENLDTKHFSCNILRRRRSEIQNRSEQKCNIEAKKEIPVGVTSAETVIETETSLDISLDKVAMSHHNGVPQVSLYFIYFAIHSILSPSYTNCSCRVEIYNKWFIICEVWGSHGCDYECSCFVGCNTV
jgi:hypothetical protein